MIGKLQILLSCHFASSGQESNNRLPEGQQLQQPRATPWVNKTPYNRCLKGNNCNSPGQRPGLFRKKHMMRPKQIIVFFRILFIFIFFLSTSCVKRGKDTAPKTRAPVLLTKKQESRSPKKQPSQICVCIDAGHGGDDPGAKAITPPHTKEKTLTLVTALKVQEFLHTFGIKTVMVRRTDRFVPLKERAHIATKKRCTHFVSIHYNSTPKPTSAKGVEVYVYETDKSLERAAASKQLASAIVHRIAKVAPLRTPTIRHGNFCVIRETKMPAVLIEGGFLSNPKEAKNLKNPRYIRLLAWAIAKGIVDVCHSTAPRTVTGQ